MSGLARIAAKGAAKGGDRLVKFTGGTLDDAVQNAVDNAVPDPNEFADTGASLGQTILRTGGGVTATGLAAGSGVYTADKYFDQQRLEEEANTEEEQREWVNELRNDPNISDEVKEQAIQTAIDNGILDQLGVDSSGEGDGSILQNTWFQIFAAILIAIIVYRRA